MLVSAFAVNALNVGSVAPQAPSRAAVSMMAKIPNKMKWVPFINAADAQKGTINSVRNTSRIRRASTMAACRF